MRVRRLVAIGAAVAAVALVTGLAPTAQSSTFPGENGLIVFHTVDLEIDNYDIWTVDPENGELDQLTDTTDLDEYAAQWSPDGTQIVFVIGDGDDTNVWVMNADGSGQTQVTDGDSAYQPTWSPDGTRIAFARFEDDGEIWVIDVDGTDEELLTGGVDSGFEPNWSPDGTQIAFGSYREDGHTGYQSVWVMDADGSNQTQLAFTEDDQSAFSPCWSPDSSRVIFTRELGGGNEEVFIVDRDGSNEDQLTDFGGENNTGCFSPDGTQITFISELDVPDSLNIYRMNADGSDPEALTDEFELAISPDWQPIPVEPTTTTTTIAPVPLAPAPARPATVAVTSPTFTG